MCLAERLVVVQDLSSRPAEATYAGYRLEIFYGLNRLRLDVLLVQLEARLLPHETKVLVVEAGEVVCSLTLLSKPIVAAEHRGVEFASFRLQTLKFRPQLRPPG